MGNAQIDGASEWATTIAQHHAKTMTNPRATFQADITLREFSRQVNRAMEGGGFMEPLPERSSSSFAVLHSRNPRAVASIAQLDGLDVGAELRMISARSLT